MKEWKFIETVMSFIFSKESIMIECPNDGTHLFGLELIPKFLIWFNSYGDIRCILDCIQYKIPTLIVISTFVYHFVIYVKSPHKLSLSRVSHPHLNLYQINTSSSVWFTHSICHHFYQFFNTQSITNNSFIRSSSLSLSIA